MLNYTLISCSMENNFAADHAPRQLCKTCFMRKKLAFHILREIKRPDHELHEKLHV